METTTKRYQVIVYFYCGGSRFVLATDDKASAIREMHSYSDARQVFVIDNANGGEVCDRKRV